MMMDHEEAYLRNTLEDAGRLLRRLKLLPAFVDEDGEDVVNINAKNAIADVQERIKEIEEELYDIRAEYDKSG